MIMSNIFGGEHLVFLIVPALVGCVLGIVLWKKRALMLALCCAAAYGLCEVLLFLVRLTQLIPAERVFMFGGYICAGLAAGVLCGGLLKRFMLRLKT